MLIYPAIDLYAGKAVRLQRGDYARMTVYSDRPEAVAADFAAQGARQIHLVDLEGARSGGTPNLETIVAVKNSSGLFCQVGGGIRSMDAIAAYLDAGVDRVILGTAAATQAHFAARAVARYGERIAVGVDIKDGFAAVKVWTEKSPLKAFEFCRRMQSDGVSTLICTDIFRDGMMQGTNVALYKTLSTELKMRIIASGGVSSLDDVKRLAALGLYGAIIGKACYTKAISIAAAIEVAK
ncbi:MAG: 1-(5-phosphoribosyl)-5-[(5-phosphoribosylamino)methylideneamino]imidazole-4-carboxamide isomerase [Pyramidobacter sp.]|nr:1-(5-phosphoribosyl)-5-[(5-phosphoribosylamino)methylideneamino]imidazole-4-carboxamide isomerase [Pyramidobacter sp.]